MGWRTKSIAQVQSEFDRGELKRSLGAIHLVLFGIGCIIGAGIFVRTGTAAALYAGPAVMLSFIIAGVVCVFAGLCYAELASMLPVSGSAYTYAYTTVGEFGAWIMGALLLLEYALAASVVAVGWSGYAVSLLHDIGLNIPAEYTQAIGKLVIAHASTFSMTDPVVSLNGVTAHLNDGSVVQFLSQGKATITGAFTTALAQNDVIDAAKGGGYALINSLDIAVKTDSHALLAEATKVMDPATTHLRDLAAGTQLIVPNGQIVQLPLATVVPVDPASVVTSLFNLPAVFITLAVTMLLILGVSESATVNNIIVAIKVTVILAFIAVGAFFVNPDNWHPFIPEPTGVENQFGIERCHSCGDDRVLCLHRFRGRLDRRTGSEESAQGHAHRHPGFAGHLHGALHGHRGGADGRGVVHQAQRRRARGHRGRHLRPAMELARQVHQDRRHRRICRRWCWC